MGPPRRRSHGLDLIGPPPRKSHGWDLVGSPRRRSHGWDLLEGGTTDGTSSGGGVASACQPHVGVGRLGACVWLAQLHLLMWGLGGYQPRNPLTPTCPGWA